MPETAKAAPGVCKGDLQNFERFGGQFDHAFNIKACDPHRTDATPATVVNPPENSAGTAIAWLRRDCLRELAELIEALGVRLIEAAETDDDRAALVIVRQLRAVLLDAIPLAKALNDGDDL
ncbi:hypothetical protein M2322_000624 [Rhodoblastus acidophilus]|uniref:hypothetical protein n=1 Tax=Rhodoblastus acidophilus TaxID=1074 RepID=UPI002224978D|nr:hypothetical protein [Rhodoblastus acidophilus]MCW2315104.1 hypothetical protein [Rhodoblastus acidophilus]